MARTDEVSGAAAPAALSAARAREILAGAAGARVIVLGDMVVDEHVIGRARGVAREAPIPVIEQDARLLGPGGATNVAANLRALGCEVLVAGVVGADSMADALREQLESQGIHTAGVMHDESRNTSVKLRVWAGGDRQRPQRMVARVDSVDRSELRPEVEEQLLLYLEAAIPAASALVISDYENGLVSRTIVDTVLPLAATHAVPVTVDAHGELSRFRGVALATPNQPEAERELGREFGEPDEMRAGAAELRELLEIDTVLVTLGEAGMVLATAADPAVHIPAQVTHVADPTGAGDTVAAAMTAALIAGAAPLEAALLADLAARVVVRRMGAAVASADDILAEVHVASG